MYRKFLFVWILIFIITSTIFAFYDTKITNLEMPPDYGNQDQNFWKPKIAQLI